MERRCKNDRRSSSFKVQVLALESVDLTTIHIGMLSPKQQATLEMLGNRKRIDRGLTRAFLWRIGEEPTMGTSRRFQNQRQIDVTRGVVQFSFLETVTCSIGLQTF